MYSQTKVKKKKQNNPVQNKWTIHFEALKFCFNELSFLKETTDIQGCLSTKFQKIFSNIPETNKFKLTFIYKQASLMSQHFLMKNISSANTEPALQINCYFTTRINLWWIFFFFVIRTNPWDSAWSETHVVKVQIIITFIGTGFTSQMFFKYCFSPSKQKQKD